MVFQRGSALKSLCLVHQDKAQLPELQAYTEYFSAKYRVFIETPQADLSTYDIVWFFMGCFRYQPQPHQFVVHEYASLSTPPMAWLKDKLKARVNSRPNLRVFQNAQQSSRLHFNDNVPVLYRDMGLCGDFTIRPGSEKQCDLIYVGTMDKSRRLERALDIILRLKPDTHIWLVGNPAAYLQQRYQHHINVRFLGKVSNKQIPVLLNQAHFGLNYVPDIYPYQFQTSTKLLEYAACGLPVIGNKTAWVNSFLATHKLPYHDIHQLAVWPTPAAVTISAEVLQSWSWQQRIADAGFETILP